MIIVIRCKTIKMRNSDNTRSLFKRPIKILSNRLKTLHG